MQRKTVQGCGLFLAMALLSSCATMMGIVTPPQNSAERRILLQAVSAGAAVGGVVGGVIGHEVDDGGWFGTTAGAVAGSIAGALAGEQIGRYQIAKLKDVKLKNEQLAALLYSARQYNQQVAAYNQNLNNEIYKIRTRKRTEREKAAQLKLKEVQAYKKGVQASIEERERLSKTLVPEQKSKYQQTMWNLEREERQLEKAIAELSRIEEQARVG